MKLSAAQRLMLNAMQVGDGIVYAKQNDPTLKALGRRGLVVFIKARKYGRDHWRATEEGKRFDLYGQPASDAADQAVTKEATMD